MSEFQQKSKMQPTSLPPLSTWSAPKNARNSKFNVAFGVVLFIVWGASLGYMGSRLKVGWVPNNEGVMGLSAERVLHGQLPHRDFDDYTGGLTFLHALAFRVFGIDSASMRYVLFGFFVPWVPAVFYIASRFGSPVSAGAVTLLAVAWSVPNYPGPMPSWYNLFFATWGVAAVFRYLDSRSTWWLFAAGLCGGLSMLAKVTGAYFIAAVLLFLVFHEQNISLAETHGTESRAQLYRMAISLLLAVFLALLVQMVRTVPGTSGLIYFVLPPVLLAVLILAREFAGIPGPDRKRFTRLANLSIPVAVGIIIVLVAFLLPYAKAYAVHDLIRGLFATPARAIRFASFHPHHPLTMISMVPFLVPLVGAYEFGRKGRAICGSIVALYGCAILYFAGKSTLAYYLGWCAFGTAIPMLTMAGTGTLWARRGKEELSSTSQEKIMLLLCTTSLCSLIQFPFSAPIYFYYVAPLVILCAWALLASAKRPPQLALLALLVIFLVFPMLSVTSYRMGISHDLDGKTELLNIARAGGLRVDPVDARQYNDLIPLVQAHATNRSIYAAPDCPEIYFLAGFPGPSRHYFDFAEDPTTYTQNTLRRLETMNVSVVAICRRADFTGPMRADLENALRERYQHSEQLGAFEVRWKN